MLKTWNKLPKNLLPLLKNKGSMSLKSPILKEAHEPTPPQESVEVNSPIEKQERRNSERLSPAQVMSYASKVWEHQQSVATFIATETSQVIQVVQRRKYVFFSGKSEKGILSGIFYLLALKNKISITQRQIARKLGTTDVTVRTSYRDWIDSFPEFFPMKTLCSSGDLSGS
jgi:hypothetical protein